MRTQDIIKTANANLFKSKLRTFLTSSAVFMGAFTLMLTTGVSFGLKTYVQEQIESAGAKDVLIIQVKSDAMNPIANEEAVEYNPEQLAVSADFGAMPKLVLNDLEKIGNQEGILSIEPLYPFASEYITTGDKKYKASLNQTIEGLNVPIKAGRQVEANSESYEITLAPEFVEPLGFSSNEDAVGNKVELGFKDVRGGLFTLEATITGVQEKTLILGNAMSTSVALGKAAFTRASEGLPDFQRYQYMAVAAKFDASMTEQQLLDVKKNLDNQGYIAQTLDDQLGTITSIIDGITVFLVVFATITLAAATFGIVNTLLMAVQERTREIGLMKALGMGRKKIFSLFSIEAVLIGFWSSLAALAAANIIGRFGNKLASDSILKSFEGLELFSFPLLPMLGIMLIVTTIAFMASTLPARRASRLDPIEALRYE